MYLRVRAFKTKQILGLNYFTGHLKIKKIIFRILLDKLNFTFEQIFSRFSDFAKYVYETLFW